jgi:hypothetical protein
MTPCGSKKRILKLSLIWLSNSIHFDLCFVIIQ